MDQRQYDAHRHDERNTAERRVRSGIDEIRAELQRLESRMKEGRITPTEFEEVREVLTSQQRHLGGAP